MTRDLSFKPAPDFGRLSAVLQRRSASGRPPLFELFSNIEAQVVPMIYRPDDRIERQLRGLEERDRAWGDHLRYMWTLGYDYVNIYPDGFNFPLNTLPSTDTQDGKRQYFSAQSVTIRDWADFDRYPWPRMTEVDYTRFARLAGRVPEGMRVLAWGSGILEYVTWLLGFEGIGYWLHDDETLVAAVFQAVGSRMIEYYDTLASIDCVAAIAMGEDMGFNTATMLSPQVYRKYLFPLHRELVDRVHRHGKPAILHSCGNLREIMDDVIACGWEAKHSFEDSIEPVWEAQRTYGHRIALLGGFDVDKLTRMSVDEVRAHTRLLIGRCAPAGGWAMGTGNSVPQYIPAENFIAMIDETFRVYD